MENPELPRIRKERLIWPGLLSQEVTVIRDSGPSTKSPCDLGCDGSGWFAVTADEPDRHGDPRPVTRMARCECLKRQIRMERVERAAATAAIPNDLRAKSFANFDTGRADEMRDRAQDWMEAFKPGCHSLLLYGNGKGTGKTHLAAAIANALLGEVPLLFVTAMDLVGQMQDYREANGLIEAAATVDLLFVDDLGQADSGDPGWLRAKKQQTWFQILNRREMGGLTTVGTSNLAKPSDFGTALGEAATDRLLGMCGPAGLLRFPEIPSYRLRGWQL